MSAVLSLRISVYLCVLCVKYIGANDLTQSTQRYAEFAEKTRTANELTFRAKQLIFDRITTWLPMIVL
jgi:hypothetical protein